LPAPRRFRTRVLAHRRLSETGRELRLERHDLSFAAGALLTVHGEDVVDDRSYNIASGTDDPHLDVLYRIMPEGRLTPRLAELEPGDAVEVSAPYGDFVVRDPARPLVFVGTGTGISPCRSFVRSHPDLDALILHGVRDPAELFYRDELRFFRYYPCVSGDFPVEPGAFPGRVSALLVDLDLPPGADFYLCGAADMIYDVTALLLKRGVEETRMVTEPYYYQKAE
jgi:ferredoxin-NADP reductase